MEGTHIRERRPDRASVAAPTTPLQWFPSDDPDVESPTDAWNDILDRNPHGHTEKEMERERSRSMSSHSLERRRSADPLDYLGPLGSPAFDAQDSLHSFEKVELLNPRKGSADGGGRPRLSNAGGVSDGMSADDYGALDHVKLRLPWLVMLMFLQSISSSIISHYSALLEKNLTIAMFITMVVGTAGNVGNQSTSLVIRGLATGEISGGNAVSVLLREFRVALVIAGVIGPCAMTRVYLTSGDGITALAIGIALMLVIVISMGLGAILPLLLHWLNFDPAHSAAPFLATSVDIIGILVLMTVCSHVLKSEL